MADRPFDDATNATPLRYGAMAQFLHWLIAALVVTQFVLAGAANDLPIGEHKLALLARHKSIGMTILALVLVRLIWRLSHTPPPLPPAMSPIQRRLAKVSHRLFYVLLFAMPLSGWLMSSAKSYSVSWFGLFTWPDLVSPNETAFNVFHAAHGLIAGGLLILAVIHVCAALKHQFWNRDDVLTRMLPIPTSKKRR